MVLFRFSWFVEGAFWEKNSPGKREIICGGKPKPVGKGTGVAVQEKGNTFLLLAWNKNKKGERCRGGGGKGEDGHNLKSNVVLRATRSRKGRQEDREELIQSGKGTRRWCSGKKARHRVV